VTRCGASGMITLAEPREHDVVLGGGSPNNVELEQG
jgi:hypothetical protein